MNSWYLVMCVDYYHSSPCIFHFAAHVFVAFFVVTSHFILWLVYWFFVVLWLLIGDLVIGCNICCQSVFHLSLNIYNCFLLVFWNADFVSFLDNLLECSLIFVLLGVQKMFVLFMTSLFTCCWYITSISSCDEFWMSICCFGDCVYHV